MSYYARFYSMSYYARLDGVWDANINCLVIMVLKIKVICERCGSLLTIIYTKVAVELIWLMLDKFINLKVLFTSKQVSIWKNMLVFISKMRFRKGTFRTLWVFCEINRPPKLHKFLNSKILSRHLKSAKFWQFLLNL